MQTSRLTREDKLCFWVTLCFLVFWVVLIAVSFAYPPSSNDPLVTVVINTQINNTR